jgi:peroxiredoxin
VKVLRLREAIEGLGATVIFVVHDEPERVRASLLDGLDVPYPVAVDLERDTYRAWGCRRASFARIWLDPRVWARYLREALCSRRAARFGVDTLQLGGDFVVDREGRIAYARPQVRDDRPPVRVLVNALEAL